MTISETNLRRVHGSSHAIDIALVTCDERFSPRTKFIFAMYASALIRAARPIAVTMGRYVKTQAAMQTNTALCFIAIQRSECTSWFEISSDMKREIANDVASESIESDEKSGSPTSSKNPAQVSA